MLDAVFVYGLVSTHSARYLQMGKLHVGSALTLVPGIFQKLILCTAAVAFTIAVVFHAGLGRSKRRNEPPRKWIKIAEVSHLRIYPLKSGKGIETNTVECTEAGVKVGDARDRMFMVVDSECGKFVSGRKYPKITQIVISVNGGRLTLRDDTDPENQIETDLPESDGESVQVSIWDALAEGIDCGDEVAVWLSRHILGQDTGLKLLYHAENARKKDFSPEIKKLMKLTKAIFEPSDAGLFSDTCSYHLVTESSVDDLNRRAGEGTEVTPFHFRPNIVVFGERLIPFEEDRWQWVKIGDVIFQFQFPCMRCSFTTIDPKTGEKSDRREPIATLRRYRLVRDPKIREIVYTPTFGIYLGARNLGSISVGDDVFIPEESE